MAKTLIKIPKETKLTLSLLNNHTTIPLDHQVGPSFNHGMIESIYDLIIHLIETQNFNPLANMGTIEDFQKYPVTVTFQAPLPQSLKDDIISAYKFQRNSEEFRDKLEELVNQYKETLSIDEIKDTLDMQSHDLIPK